MKLGRGIRRGLWSGGLGLVLIYFGLALMTARTAVFPWWYHRSEVGVSLPSCSTYMQKVYEYCSDPRKAFDLEYSDFAIVSPVPVKGWVVLAPDPATLRGTIVLVHGGGADRRAMLKHVPYLHAAGYDVVLIDCYNHGLNNVDGRGLSFGLFESKSVVAAAEWASHTLPHAAEHPVIAMGTSQGAFSALRAMSMTPVIRAVVAENPYLSVKRLLREFPALSWEPRIIKEGAMVLLSRWLGEPLDELDVRRFAGELGARPVFLLHGTADEIVDPHQSEEIYGLLSGPKELWLVPDGEHEFLWNKTKKEYEARVLRFLATVQ